MKKVLVLVPNLRVCNGVASYIMNYYRHMKHDEVTMDFVTLRNISSPYVDEIIKSGGHVFVMPSLMKIFTYCKSIRKIYKENHYDAMHCNVTNAAVLYLYYAKKMGIKTRILHSHATKSAEVKWKEWRNNLIAPIAVSQANTYFACSKMAGEYLFKKRPFTVINNAIDVDVYKLNVQKRVSLRKEFGISENFVVGTVARISQQKNPFFAMDIFKEVLHKDANAIYLWAGTGFLDNEVKEYAKKLGITHQVRFLGNRSDVADLYQIFDVFLLPSFYEGLPVVGIEAQACGVPVVLSDTITKEMQITQDVQYCALDMSTDQWAEVLLSYKGHLKKNMTEELISAGYGIQTQAKKLQEFYDSY